MVRVADVVAKLTTEIFLPFANNREPDIKYMMRHIGTSSEDRSRRFIPSFQLFCNFRPKLRHVLCYLNDHDY